MVQLSEHWYLVYLKKKENKHEQKTHKMKNLEELIRSGSVTIVDVRSKGEFLNGHVKGSINIPLQEIPQRLEQLRGMKDIVLCCASGNRSGQAAAFLEQNSITCKNAGSWEDLNY